MTDTERITELVAARMGRYVFWSRYDGKWLVRKNCNLAGIVHAVLQEAGGSMSTSGEGTK